MSTAIFLNGKNCKVKVISLPAASISAPATPMGNFTIFGTIDYLLCWIIRYRIKNLDAVLCDLWGGFSQVLSLLYNRKAFFAKMYGVEIRLKAD